MIPDLIPDPTPDSPEELVSIEGILVAGRPGQVRLLVDQAVVDLDEEDVVDARELPSPPELAADRAQPVRLDLRRGARLLGVGAAEAYEGVVWEHGELFALRTRRNEEHWRMSPAYLERERRFFESYGIVVDRTDPEEENQP